MRPVVKVLLADDESDVLEELSDTLVYQKILVYHFEVVAAVANGEEAVKQAQQHQPDLAILDLEMPKLDGMAAAKAMCQLSPAPKVLLYSCHHDRVDIHAALEADVRGYVLKGRSQALFHAIDEILNHRNWFEPLVFQQMYGKSLRGEAEGWISPLTTRESEVLDLFRQGNNHSLIATELKMSLETAKSHLAHIRVKAGCSNLSELKQKLPKLSIH